MDCFFVFLPSFLMLWVRYKKKSFVCVCVCVCVFVKKKNSWKRQLLCFCDFFAFAMVATFFVHLQIAAQIKSTATLFFFARGFLRTCKRSLILNRTPVAPFYIASFYDPMLVATKCPTN